jgi:hypothetical protein
MNSHALVREAGITLLGTQHQWTRGIACVDRNGVSDA